MKSKHSTYLQAMECIVSRKNNRSYCEWLAMELGLTTEQTELLSFFCSRADDNNIKLSDIGRMLGKSFLSMLSLTPNIDVLVQKHYLRKTKHSSVNYTYAVNKEALEALARDERYVCTRIKIDNVSSLFYVINKMIDELTQGELDKEAFEFELDQLLHDCKHLLFAKQLLKTKLEKSALNIFIYLCNAMIIKADEDITANELMYMYDDICFWHEEATLLLSGNHQLMQLGLIEGQCSTGLFDGRTYRLTIKAKTTFFPGMSFCQTSVDGCNVIKHEEVGMKRLFFNKTVQAQVDEVSALLKPRKYKQVVSRLQESGLRKGVCMLFYGGPGTGKTESVYQIARESGRDIFKVDASALKDKYVGESEKLVKGVFEQYKLICNNKKRVPILLFNEADAIFNKRLENISHSVDQMANTCQNIILDELENFEGILIATTNLETQMDAAFERRFLYKIHFDKPDEKVRASILRSMIPELTPNEATDLARRYSLSGGQIENIARKRTIKYAMNGKKMQHKEFMALCEAENLKKQRNVIGFNQVKGG